MNPPSCVHYEGGLIIIVPVLKKKGNKLNSMWLKTAGVWSVFSRNLAIFWPQYWAIFVQL